jgi:hypothetical protein
MTEARSQFEHEKYEELCAFATAGVLTSAQSEMLFTHLNECAACSEMFAEYQAVAAECMDFLHKRHSIPKAVAGFDEDKALARLMEATATPPPQQQPLTVHSHAEKRNGPNRAWFRGAMAASILCVAAGLYWAAVRWTGMTPARTSAAVDARLTQARTEKQVLQRIIEADNQRISALEQQVNSTGSEIERLHAEARSTADNLVTTTASLSASKGQSDAQIAALIQERDAAATRSRDSEAKYQAAQDELNTLRSQHQRDLLQVTSLEKRVDTLSTTLTDSDARAKNDEQYLSSDKDIRDLIGARNLLIADILDVDESGQTRKPVGRVFYTKTKSLIFYAYDLDRQPGVKRSSTFQVWGRTGPRDRNPVNLGILYMDSESNRRWTLRLDNMRQLTQLDSIFVTIEPKIQVDKPTGKQFLYASLRREPNHP